MWLVGLCLSGGRILMFQVHVHMFLIILYRFTIERINADIHLNKSRSTPAICVLADECHWL